MKHTWDAGGSLASRYNVLTSDNETFGYDFLDRLTSVSGAYTDNWTYSPIGNIATHNGTSYTYPANGVRPHAVTQVGSANYTYDANGNMLTRGSANITWDAENRPVSMTINGVTTNFTYDGDGNRVKQAIMGGNTTLYVNKYYERNQTTGENITHYYLGNRQIAVRNSTSLTYIQQDHLTGTSVMTDSSGNSIGTIGYMPFGSVRSASGTIPTDKKFTGQRLDGTGLYYYNARYYDPTTGRFISPDTVIPNFGNPQALNRYSYVYNNPLKYNDPSGHFAWLAALAIVNVVVNYAGISYDIYQLAQDPSLANLGWLALDLFDPTPIPHGALNQGARALEKAVVKEVAEQAGQEALEKVGKEVAEDLPVSTHHIFTDKSKTWTPIFEETTSKYGLSLDESWNKIEIPQNGRHPDVYHEWAYDQLQTVDQQAAGNTDDFLDLFNEQIKTPLQENPDMLFKWWWDALLY